MTSTVKTLDLEIEQAARRLYDAEVALHIARQSGVDAWVKAAADRLHEAIISHRALEQEWTPGSPHPADH
jgi:hypothetical protein